MIIALLQASPQAASDPLQSLKDIGFLIGALGGAGGILKFAFGAARFFGEFREQQKQTNETVEKLLTAVAKVTEQNAVLIALITTQPKRQ